MFSTLWIPISNPYTMYLQSLNLQKKQAQRKSPRKDEAWIQTHVFALSTTSLCLPHNKNKVLIMNFRFLNSLHSYLRCDQLCLILISLHCHVPFDLHVDMNINLNVH